MMFARVYTLACLVHSAAAAPMMRTVPSDQNLDLLTIVQLAEALPELSILVTALKAANLTGALSGPGPFTVFAPTNEAFAALPPARLNSLVEPCIVEPCSQRSPNIEELQAVLQYHVIGHSVDSRDLRNNKRIETLEGESVEITLRSGAAFVDRSRLVKADIAASNGVVHTINKVLEPLGINRLYFRYITGEYNCGQVDASPRMPSAIFEPQNAQSLQEYIDVVLAFPWDTPFPFRKLSLGTCGEYIANAVNLVSVPVPCSKINSDPVRNPFKNGTGTIDWAPVKFMEPLCSEHCDCDYAGSPGTIPCKDVPDDPLAGTWCSLCGPKFNAPVDIHCFETTPFQP